MLFATGSLARRIEHAETTMMAQFGRAAGRRLGDDSVIVSEIGGGVAVMPGPASPLSKVAGLGFAALNEDALAAVERDFSARRTAVRVELATLADPAVGAMLTRRGYVLSGYENVLGVPLDAARPRPAIGAVNVTRITQDAAHRWMHVVTTGFMHPDVFDGPPAPDVIDPTSIGDVFEDMGHVDRLVRYLAMIDGEPAGGASMRMAGGVAQLCGAATLPFYRRRGVQTTLFRERLADAAREGCDVAIVTTEPGSRSQENAQRQGFELLYARAILVKAADVA